MSDKIPSEISVDTLSDLYRRMILIRRFEEKIIDLYPAQDMKTPVHLYIGQEAIAASVCANLKKEDYIFSTHRSHGHYLAKGAPMRPLLAEFYGKRDGCCRGKGGSMHPVAPDFGILGTTAIVGGGIPIAVGTALASKMKRDGNVTVVFFGDGASDQGVFYESMNYASLKDLPVVFLCENNFYATNSPQSARHAVSQISRRASGFGIDGESVDGNDVLAVYEASAVAIEKARLHHRPSLIECSTYRWKGHVGPDCDYIKGCRPKEELEAWMGKCPIVAFKEKLLAASVLSETDFAHIEREIARQIDDAVAYAKNSPLPDQAELYDNVYYERSE